MRVEEHGHAEPRDEIVEQRANPRVVRPPHRIDPRTEIGRFHSGSIEPLARERRERDHGGLVAPLIQRAASCRSVQISGANPYALAANVAAYVTKARGNAADNRVMIVSEWPVP